MDRHELGPDSWHNEKGVPTFAELDRHALIKEPWTASLCTATLRRIKLHTKYYGFTAQTFFSETKKEK